MYDIEQDSVVPGYPYYRVMVGGQYEPDDLVGVYRVGNPGVAEVAFRAAYLAGEE